MCDYHSSPSPKPRSKGCVPGPLLPSLSSSLLTPPLFPPHLLITGLLAYADISLLAPLGPTCPLNSKINPPAASLTSP